MSFPFLGFGFSPGCPRVCSAKSPPRFLSLADRPHYRLPGYASKRSLIDPSACLTIGPALCSAGRPIRSFCLGSAPAFSSPPCAPAFSPPFPPTLFTPRSPCFFNRALSPCFSVFLYAGAIGGLCRRAALPVRTLPPADLFRPRDGFHVKQTRTPRCFMSSTASRVNSRPHPLPGCLFHLSVLNDYLARTFTPARRFPY